MTWTSRGAGRRVSEGAFPASSSFARAGAQRSATSAAPFPERTIGRSQSPTFPRSLPTLELSRSCADAPIPSRSLIFSSRRTTTSSNFSRSQNLSLSSLLDFSQSEPRARLPTHVRGSTPMAPITLPSGSLQRRSVERRRDHIPALRSAAYAGRCGSHPARRLP